jgi:rubredoxin
VRSRAVIQVAVAVLLLGVAGWLLARHFTARPVSEQVPVRCVVCGHVYVPKGTEDDPECPKCHARGGLQLVYYHCSDCGATFLAYEQDPRRGLIREPGGEWTTTQAFVPHPVVCPECSSSNTAFVRKPGQAVASEARGK